MQDLTIAFRRAENGSIVDVVSGENVGDVQTFVHQDGDFPGDDVEAFADLLRLIEEQWGPTTSRYSPKRIVIRVEPGDKYDPSAVEDMEYGNTGNMTEPFGGQIPSSTRDEDEDEDEQYPRD